MTTGTIQTVIIRGEVAPILVWRVEGEGRGKPGADLEAAYFLSRRHEVIAVDAKRGTIKWRQSTNEPGDSTAGSTVVLTGNTVVVGDYNLIGLDRRTGAFRWKFEPRDGYASGTYLGTAARGIVYTGSAAGRLYAVDGTTGLLRWSGLVADDRNTTVYQPVVNGGLVAASYTTFTAPPTGGVAVFDAVTGLVRWQSKFPAPSKASLGTNTTGSLVVTNNSVIAPSGDGQVVAFDRRMGAVQWVIPQLPDLSNLYISGDHDIRPITHLDRTLFVGSLYGYVVAYDLDTRRELWRYDGTRYGSVIPMITAADGVVYVPYVGSRLVALNSADGTERWAIGDFDTPFTWPILPRGNRLYAASSKGGFFAFAIK